MTAAPGQAPARRVPLAWLLAGGAAILYVLYLMRHAVVPFLLSFALAYAVNPVISYFEARGYRRDMTVVMLYLIIAVLISGLANFLLPTVGGELSQLQSQAPAYYEKARASATELQAYVAARLPVGQNLVQHMSMKMYTPLMEHLQKLPSYLLGLFPLLSLLFLVPFITFFALMDSSRAMQGLIQWCPSRYVEPALHLITDVDTSLGNYARGILIEALAVAVASFIGLALLGVDYALAIATLAGLANLIPYAGPVIGAAIGGAVALVQFRDIWMVGKVLIMFGVVRLLDDVLLQPVISRHAVHLHPMVYLLALLIGGHAFGFMGLLLGVPAACVVKSLCRVAWAWYSSEARMAAVHSPAGARIPYT